MGDGQIRPSTAIDQAPAGLRNGTIVDEQTTADMDGGWKQLIEEYLEEFFRFFLPGVHAGIDFRRGYQYFDNAGPSVRISK